MGCSSGYDLPMIRLQGRGVLPGSRRYRRLPNEVYLDLDPQPIDLVDINGNPTGVRVMNEALSPNPRILTALYPGHLKIDWAPIGVVPGTLESAPEATGPWADMPGAVPVYEAPITGERRFFRVRF